MQITNEQMKAEFLEMLMEQCPYEIPGGEEDLVKGILNEVVFGPNKAFTELEGVGE